MFGFRRRGSEGKDDAAAVSVALIGESHRRSYVRDVLGARAKVDAELATDKRAHMLAEIGPEVVVLDCASEGVNPLLALPRLAGIEGSPRVVALTDGELSHAVDATILASLGADATAEIRDGRAVVEAVLSRAPTPAHRRGRALVAA